MPILLTTFGLLLVFSLIAVEQATVLKDSALVNQITQSSFSEYRKNIENELKKMAKKIYFKNRPKQMQTPQEKKQLNQGVVPGDESTDEPMDDDPQDHLDPDGFDSEKSQNQHDAKDRRTSYLHLQDIFDDSTEGVAGRANVCKMIFQALIAELCRDRQFCQEIKGQYPDVERQFVEQVYREGKILMQNKKTPTNARQLKGIHFDDEALKHFRMKLFSGKEHLRDTYSDKDAKHYMLSEYISLKKSKYIVSIWLAPPLVLRALYQNDAIVEELLATRAQFYKTLHSSKNRKNFISDYSNELRTQFRPPLEHYGDYIDYRVSTSRPNQEFTSNKKEKK